MFRTNDSTHSVAAQVVGEVRLVTLSFQVWVTSSKPPAYKKNEKFELILTESAS